MTIPTAGIDQVIPGEGSMAQPSVAPGRARRHRLRFVANGKAATGLVLLGGYLLFR
jgi:peptide/nickel transport system permease protein